MKILKTYQRPFVRERRQEINVNKLKINEKNKIKFLTEHEPSLPNIYNRCRKTSLLLKSNEELRNILRKALEIFKWCIENEVKLSKSHYLTQILIQEIQVILFLMVDTIVEGTVSIVNTWMKRVNIFIVM